MKEIHCDGSCFGNPGPGGWGVWVKEAALTAEIYGHQARTTNNQMELMAAITALKFISPGENANIYTDSQYVIKGITEWIKGWKRNNWVTSKKEVVKNSDLWKELDNLNKDKKVSWIWVKGHSGDIGNDIVDNLAKMGTKGKSNIHLLEQLISKFISLDKETPKEKIISVEFNLHSILSRGKHKYVVIDSNAVIYPEVKAYLLQKIGGTLQMVAKTLAHKDFSLLEEKDAYLIVLRVLKEFNQDSFGVYSKLKNLCVHEIVNKYESAICSKCDLDLGWYCPESPDNQCHYYTQDGKITLLNGEKVLPPVNYDKNHESDDWCIFCGDPEERK